VERIPPNSESQRAFVARIGAAVETLLVKHEGTVLFVTHAGVFGCLYSQYGYPKHKIENGVLYELHFSERGDALVDVLCHKA
jgi:broad specificity phosphatase PhoE